MEQTVVTVNMLLENEYVHGENRNEGYCCQDTRESRQALINAIQDVYYEYERYENPIKLAHEQTQNNGVI